MEFFTYGVTPHILLIFDVGDLLRNFFLFESPFICKLYKYIQQMV
jgi:hypothetical protein